MSSINIAGDSSGQITLAAPAVAGTTTLTLPATTGTVLNDATVGVCRAWVNFNGAGTVAIRASFNVSSITDNGTGDYTVNFTTAMPDAKYALTYCGSQDGAPASMLCPTIYSSAAVLAGSCRTIIGHYSGGSTNYRDVDQGHIAVHR